MSSSEKRPRVETGDSSGGSCGGGSRFKGVRMRKWGKWVAEVRLPNSRKRIWLGSYDTPEKAARAYDAAVFCLRGPGATFNFPDNPPRIPDTEKLTPVQIQAAAARFAHEHQSAPVPNDTMSASREFQMDGGSNTEQTRWPPVATSMSGSEASDMELFGSDYGASPLECYFTRAEEEEEEEEYPCDGGALYQQPGLWSF
ncbi:ethylene-responsive transcription factor ERF017-like [Aristolochia californica]|uniref:ethylene-responsive transcription factor ERF017-like n=1 Tax=Aristolochia californica TaxID=171875 RepID=UPI0035E29219